MSARGDASPTLKRIDHVAMVVADLSEARAFFGERLGFHLVREVHRDDAGVDAEFYGRDGVEIEVVWLRDDSARAETLRGESVRVIHVAFEVDDLEGVAEELRLKGVEMTEGAPQARGGRSNYWTRLDTSAGLQYQLLSKL